MFATPPLPRPAAPLLDRPIAPCCAIGLLWLGGGLLCLLLFPPLRGSLGGWGWMPLFLVLMPAALLLANALLRSTSGSAGPLPRTLPRRGRPRQAGRTRLRRRRLAQRQLVALLLGLGLHRG